MVIVTLGKDVDGKNVREYTRTTCHMIYSAIVNDPFQRGGKKALKCVTCLGNDNNRSRRWMSSMTVDSFEI